MCKLVFKYHSRNQSDEISSSISKDVRREFERQAYDLWASICVSLDEHGGYIKAVLSADSSYVESGRIIADKSIVDLCVTHNIPNAIKITQVYLEAPDEDDQ